MKRTCGITKSKSGHYAVWMSHTPSTIGKLDSVAEARRVLAKVKKALSAPDVVSRDQEIREIFAQY